LESRIICRLCAVVVLASAPAFADGAPASLATIAAALREGRAQDAEAQASSLLGNPSLTHLDNTYLLLDRALAREQLGKREDSIADFTAAIDENVLPRGDLARALFDRGVTQDELGRTADAIADYSRALGLVPGYATALNNRANAYRRTGQLQLARSDYRAALAAGDDEPEYPYYGLGRVAEAQGDSSAAESYYRKALAANAQFGPASERLTSLASEASPKPPLHAPDEAVAEPVKQAQAAPAKPHSPSESDLRPAILDPAPRNARPVRVAETIPAELPLSVASASGEMVQLGAWHAELDAARAWNHLVDSAGGLLGGFKPHIMEADVPGKGRYWRLRTNAPEGMTASAFCAQLKAKGLNCIAAKS